MNTITAQHISDVIGYLNDNADYAVLRNYEGLPDKNDSRDCDIIITRKSYRKIKPGLVKLIEDSGWKIITYLNSDRLITYVCARLDDGELSIMQWDFFFNTSVFGILLMDASEFLKHKEFNGFLYHTNVESQFLDKYLYNRCVGAKYPDKYASTRTKAENSREVKDKLKAVLGVDSVAKGDKASSKKMLLHAIWWNVKRNPLSLIWSIILFLYTFVRNYVKSDTGFSIGFTGPDGAGKTTVIDGMIAAYGDIFRSAHAYYHFRPALFGNIGDVAQSAGLKKDVDRNYSDPHRGGKTSALNSSLRLMYYSVDYIIGYFVKVKSLTRITRMVVFDRYYTDIICDSRRSRIYLNYKFLYWWGKLLIPTLDYNILLTASTDVILNRKQELDRKGIEDINLKIDYLSTHKHYYRILNDGTPSEAISQILDIVLTHQNAKNIKRLK